MGKYFPRFFRSLSVGHKVQVAREMVLGPAGVGVAAAVALLATIQTGNRPQGLDLRGGPDFGASVDSRCAPVSDNRGSTLTQNIALSSALTAYRYGYLLSVATASRVPPRHASSYIHKQKQRPCVNTTAAPAFTRLTGTTSSHACVSWPAFRVSLLLLMFSCCFLVCRQTRRRVWPRAAC